jgi:hypothetical protein
MKKEILELPLWSLEILKILEKREETDEILSGGKQDESTNFA